MSQSGQVTRVTYFKIADEEAREKLLGLYKNLQSKAIKDGKQYIVAAKAGHIVPDKRNQGYNVAATTTFASLEDFDFYDKECGGHKEVRSYAATVYQGSMMVYFQSVV